VSAPWLLLAAGNLLALLAFAWDKAAARRGARRTQEARLLLLALLGGVGALLGMILCRHKTRKARCWLAALAGCALAGAAVLVLLDQPASGS
jgi:uncharacterized membrane protein YsdA (DUF1294 family)